MVLNEKLTLSNGMEIPKLALGTWQISNEEVVAAVKAALSMGYRHIDTAAAYGNEEGVGQALAESGIDRKDIFLTTKVPAEIKTYEGAKESIEASLKKLGTDYIDLMLIHAPRPWSEMHAGATHFYYEENVEVWKAIEEAHKEGKLRAIGVSNFEISDIENLLAHEASIPMANQIRVHVGHVPKELIDYCNSKNILVEAYSPNATGRLINNPKVVEMAAKYGVSSAQLAIRFDLQLGLLPLPKSRHEEYIRQNAEVDFVISDEDMQTLLAMTE